MYLIHKTKAGGVSNFQGTGTVHRIIKNSWKYRLKIENATIYSFRQKYQYTIMANIKKKIIWNSEMASDSEFCPFSYKISSYLSLWN